MSIEVQERPKKAETKLSVIDVDIHPMFKTPDALDPYLPARWREHMREYGQIHRQPYVGGSVYPKAAPALSRRDSWPPNGGPPGSDLQFMREQHLDPNNIEFGVLQLLYPNTRDERNPELAKALCSATNDWQLVEWAEPEPRIKASIVIPTNDTAAAVKEIEARAGNRAYAQVFMTPRTFEPVGSKRYWPIFEAAVSHDLPIGMHAGGVNGLPVTSSGWPSYYLEEHQCQSLAVQAALTNLLLSGVFEHLPTLRLVSIEGGFGFVPAMAWRLDKIWERNRSELPQVKRPPSEYLKQNIWFATQPAEEPEKNAHMLDLLEWIGWDRLVFASDYPHWDFDDPRYAFKVKMSDDQLGNILAGNARAIYRF